MIMKLKIIASFIAALTYVTLIAQNPVLNYKNFIGPMYNSFDLTSSKVNISDTLKILETGQNLTWDFSQFGSIKDSNLSKISYTFLPKEESWLIDSATNLFMWTEPKIEIVFRLNRNRTIPDFWGDTIQDFEEIYFAIDDTSILVQGEGSPFINQLYSLHGVVSSYIFGFDLNITKPIENLPIQYNQVLIDSFNIDTLGSTPTFWTIRKRHNKKYIDATGKIIFPFGEVENSMRLIDIAYVETEKVNKNTGLSTIDSIIGFDAYWYAPDLQHCVPITKMSFYAEKPTGGKWNVSKLDAYITDQQSLTILENWSTPIENWFYPNPATNEITLVGFENAKSFKIYGLNGQILKQGLLNQNVINTESLSPNFYILEVFDGKTAFKSKLVIQ